MRCINSQIITCLFSLLQAVSKRFNELFDPSNWHRIDASSTIDDIHQEILKHTTEVIDEVSKRPIKTLWTNDSHEI